MASVTFTFALFGSFAYTVFFGGAARTISLLFAAFLPAPRLPFVGPFGAVAPLPPPPSATCGRVLFVSGTSPAG